MTRSLIRSLVFLALTVLVPVAVHAQLPTLTPTPTQTAKPSPSPTPRVTPPPPIPTPTPRYELPATTLPERDRMRDVIESRGRWYRPIIRVGQNYTLRAGDSSQELVVILGDVRVEGRVTRDLVVVMGNATIASTAVIERSLVVVGGSATVERGAVIDDDVVVIGGTFEAPADFFPRGEHVVIGSPAIGAALQGIVPWVTRGLLLGRLIVPDLGWNWLVVAIAFVIGLLLNQVFNRQVNACIDVLSRRPLSAFLMGLLMMLLAPIILTLVAASVVGLLVVPFAFFAFVLAAMIGKVGVTRIIGGAVARQEEGSAARGLAAFLIGSIILTLAYMLPVLGLLTWATVGVFGFGAATMAFMATLRRERPVPPSKAPVTPVTPEPPPAPAPVVPDAASASVAGTHQTYAAPPDPAPAAAAAAPEPPPAPVYRAPVHSGGGFDLGRYPRATFLDRVAAIVLDTILVAIVVNIFDNRWDHDGGAFLFVLLFYHVAFWTWKGTTLGGIICGVRVARMTAQGAVSEIRFIDAFVRAVSPIFSVVALGLGVFWMLQDRDAQMWHDKIAGTIVVKAPREVVLA